jgi:hypothetical protein
MEPICLVMLFTNFRHWTRYNAQKGTVIYCACVQSKRGTTSPNCLSLRSVYFAILSWALRITGSESPEYSNRHYGELYEWLAGGGASGWATSLRIPLRRTTDWRTAFTRAHTHTHTEENQHIMRPRKQNGSIWAMWSHLFIYGSTALVDLGRFFSFFIYTQSVGLLGRGISPSQGRYLHTE